MLVDRSLWFSVPQHIPWPLFPTTFLYRNSIAKGLLDFCISVQKRTMGRFSRSWNQNIVNFFSTDSVFFMFVFQYPASMSKSSSG